MELNYYLYNRVAQGDYTSVECWDGWTPSTTRGICYKLNPSGGTLNYDDALACCSSVGGQITPYDQVTDVFTLISSAGQIYTTLHYEPSSWTPESSPAWDGGVDPIGSGLECATAGDSDAGAPISVLFYGSDCATAQNYVCEVPFPFSSNIDFYDQRGSSFFIASNPSDTYGPTGFATGTGKVDIFWTRTQNQIYDNLWPDAPNQNKFTIYGEIEQEGFGASISYLNDHITKHQLFVGALTPSKAPVGCTLPFQLNNGKVYVYDGEYTKWTANQILLPPAKFNEQSFYGAHIDSDRAHLHTLIVGCVGCNYTTNSGAVYIYETDPSTSRWSQSQILVPSSGRFYLAKDRVRIHDDIILADSAKSVLIWKKANKIDTSSINSMIKTEDAKPKPIRWSQQQILSISTYDLSSFDVFDDIIIAGSTEVPYNAHTNVGAVFILYPNTPEFGIVSKKPQPLQWSVHQILYPPTSSNNLNFGRDVSISADRIAVTSGGVNSFIYASPNRNGVWSLQQTLTHTTNVIQTVIEGSTIYSLLNLYTNALEVYDQSNSWDCLVISLEDHFGDGWDDALLTVRTPAGPTKDEFHPRCDLENPFQFRYCPASTEHEGIYSFSIPDARKSKYYWEIIWRVFLESTGEWIVGNWDTIMDFEWDISTGSFKTKKINKKLSNNVTCQSCKTRPTPKPTPLLHRRLKGGDDGIGHTLSPTISPAPTIKVSSGTVWQYFEVSTTAVDWFVDSHKSTSYYISDIEGHRLLSVGTFCSTSAGTSKLCWEDFPDGEYVLRIGGALNPYSTQHSIKWCKSVNPISAQTQIVVKIADRDCEVISYITRQQFCETQLDFDTIVEFELVLTGLTSELTSADSQQIANALDSVFHGFTTASIKSSSLTSNGLYLVINAHLNNHASGYDLSDPTIITQIESNMKTIFQNSERNLWVALVSTDSKSLLHSVSQVSFVSLHFIGTETPALTLNQIADEVVTFYPETIEEEPKEASNLLSTIGYIFTISSFILVAIFMAIRKETKSNKVEYSQVDIESEINSVNNKNNEVIEIENSNNSEKKKVKNKEENKNNSKTAKKSKKKISSKSKPDDVKNRVFANDLPLQQLKELANAEDEYLSLTKI